LLYPPPPEKFIVFLQAIFKIFMFLTGFAIDRSHKKVGKKRHQYHVTTLWPPPALYSLNFR
ncbi:hypothetical protein, partial [Desulfovibrio sp. An276]|uniref:hypothetical protein n=1 Tax=Desulfovibrio sp. An276 TaxID=1965618 RepID=UPI0019515295